MNTHWFKISMSITFVMNIGNSRNNLSEKESCFIFRQMIFRNYVVKEFSTRTILKQNRYLMLLVSKFARTYPAHG